MSSGGIGPNLILKLCLTVKSMVIGHVFICKACVTCTVDANGGEMLENVQLGGHLVSGHLVSGHLVSGQIFATSKSNLAGILI